MAVDGFCSLSDIPDEFWDRIMKNKKDKDKENKKDDRDKEKRPQHND
jgi:hypothetical protein